MASNRPGADSTERGDGFAALVSRLADSLGTLITRHIALVRIELADDARAALTSARGMLLFGLLALVGYTLVALGFAMLLAPMLSLAGALLLVGGFHLVVGVGVSITLVRRLGRSTPLNETAGELGRSAALVLGGSRAEQR